MIYIVNVQDGGLFVSIISRIGCLVPGEGRWDRRARRKEIKPGKVCECCFGEVVVSQMM